MYTDMISNARASDPKRKWIGILVRINLDAYFTKLFLWLVEFVECGRVYLVDICIHVVMNIVVLVI